MMQKIKAFPIYIGVLILSICALIPFYLMLIMGTYISEDLFKGVKFLPGNYLIQNFKTVSAINFAIYYKNSLIVAITHVCAVLFVSALTGYTFAKYEFKFKKALFYIILATMMIPQQTSLVGFVIEMKWFKMTDTLWPLIISGIASPFGTFWMTQYISTSIPDEMIESARIDGCSEIRIFLQIVLPLIRPAFTALFLLFFLWTWNNYLMPLVIINKPSLYTVPLAISMIGSEYRNDFAARILALSIATIPIIILFAIGSKHLIRGLTAGSIKG